MELGEKILQARQALGLSQRQLCGDTITRNMLSQIEHGTARPSMDTLRILAQRLGKPLRYFLEEESEVTANGTVMEQIRSAWGREEYELARELLSGYQKPDPIFDWAYELYAAMIRLALAEQALETGKLPYARSLLDSLDVLPEGFPELSRKKAWLEARLTGNCSGLPSLDEELFLRAKDAFGRGQYDRCGHLMDAMEDPYHAAWQMLRGDLNLARENWQEAAEWYHLAENAQPAETAPKLEQCYRELGDFRRAYEYACRRRDDGK